MAERNDVVAGNGTDRRDFLRTGAVVAAGGLIFGDWSAARAADLPKRRLGRTGLEVTTISTGGNLFSTSAHARVIDHAIDRGINLFHISAHYQKGRAIQVLGEVMSRKRDQVFIALKESPTDRKIDNYLRTLNTDHVDLIVPPLRPDTRRDDAVIEAFERLKAQGKVRFLGFTAHSDMAGVIRARIGGSFDCCLCHYNIGVRDELNPIIRQAVQRQNMGFLVMKSSRGLDRSTPAKWQAGLRNLLANRDLASLTLGVGSTQHIDQNVAAVLQRDARADAEFARYAAACAGTMCSFCGDCAKACPHGVAVMDYLRAGLLYRDRGDLDLATELLRDMPARRSLAMCNNCGLCNAACGKHLDVLGELRRTARI